MLGTKGRQFGSDVHYHMTISYVVIGHFVGTILNHYHPTLENV